MQIRSLPQQEILVRKLESIHELAEEERQVLRDLALRIVELPARTDFIHEDDRPTESCLLLDGLICRYKIVLSGKRQIMSFHTPGDIPDLESLFLSVIDHNHAALAPSRVAFISHRDLRHLIRRFPNIAEAFWRDTLIDGGIFREWVVNIGRRNAYQRLAHLFCEIMMRLRAMELVEDNSYEFPVTQAELGDATGLSHVHVNRTLTELRQDGLVEIRRSRVNVLDWERLKQAAEFDPAYLHQKGVDLS